MLISLSDAYLIGFAIWLPTYDLLKRLAPHARSNRNFRIQTTSCDDDHQGYPGGHWFAIESARGSNNYRRADCTSGEGGGGHGVNGVTSNGGGCCNFNVLGMTNYETYPLPVKVCASINTGGGVSIAFNRVELRFKD